MADEIDIAEVAKQLYNILKSLEAGDRHKVIKAASALLGDNHQPDTTGNSASRAVNAEDNNSTLHNKAKIWVRQNNLTESQLDHIFHSNDGTIEVIISEAPGNNLKEKTLNAYILTGVAHLLQTGEAKFDDKSAREVCRSLGCLNEGNHAKYMKEKGNLFGGSKSAGWTLTSPGLKSAAEMIKGLVSE